MEILLSLNQLFIQVQLEEICVPILEAKSKLKYNKDFFVGYSPERINPGDKEHTVTNILKVTQVLMKWLLR